MCTGHLLNSFFLSGAFFFDYKKQTMSLNQLQTLVSEGHPYWYSYAVSRGRFSKSLSPVSGAFYSSIENAWKSLWDKMNKINEDLRSERTEIYDGRMIYDPNYSKIINKTTELEIDNFDNWNENDIRSPDKMKNKLQLGIYSLVRSEDIELFTKFHERIIQLYDIYNNKYNFTRTNRISSKLEKKISAYEEKKKKERRKLREQYVKQRKEQQKEQQKKKQESKENLFQRARKGEFNDDDDEEVKYLKNELKLIDQEKKKLKEKLDKIEKKKKAAKAATIARKQRIQRRREDIVNKVSEAIETIKNGNTRRTCFDGTNDDAKLGDGTTKETCFDQYQLIYNLIRDEKDEEVKRQIKERLEEFQALYTKNQKLKKSDSKKFHRTGLRYAYNGLTHEKLMQTLLKQLEPRN